MTADPDAIVTFSAPPIAEAVTAVSFPVMPLDAFFSIASLYDERWRGQFPKFQLQAPYDPPQESFEGANVARAQFEFGVQAVPPLPRIWFVSPQDDELLQVQAGWFATNWRGSADSPGKNYPRWPVRRAEFISHWNTLTEWLQLYNHVATPSQYEITYINHIRPIKGLWEHHRDADRVVNGALAALGESVRSEQSTWRLQSLVETSDDIPPARLHVALSPAYSGPGPEPVPLLVLELTVRGEPKSHEGGLEEALDRARRVVVQSFMAITTDAAREAWGEQR